jgi:IrrE N-terminal-like domain
MRRGFKAWAEKQALSYRLALKLSAHEYLGGRQLAAHLGICIWGPNDIQGLAHDARRELLLSSQSLWSAVMLPGTNPPVLVHNTAHAPARQESNLMHELAHVVCGHTPGGVVVVCGMPCRKYNDSQEEEAAWLGGCLQVPRDALLYLLSRDASESEIAKQLKCSVPIVRYRINVTGVRHQMARGRRRGK